MKIELEDCDENKSTPPLTLKYPTMGGGAR